MDTRTLTHGMTGHRVLHIALWGATWVLSLAFAITASIKLVFPLHSVREILPWTRSFTPLMIRSLGVIELIGVQGMLLPGLTRSAPSIVPMASAGLALLMVAAGCFHLVRNEPGQIGLPVVLFILATFITWGRAAAVPIHPLRA
jgi:putative oxidoreductase